MDQHRRLIPPVNTRCRVIDAEWNKIHPQRKSYLFKRVESRSDGMYVVVREEYGFAGSSKHDIFLKPEMVFYYE